jgi:hypothetical protein
MLTTLSIVSLDQGKIHSAAQTPDQICERLADDAVVRSLGPVLAAGRRAMVWLASWSAGRGAATKTSTLSHPAAS